MQVTAVTEKDGGKEKEATGKSKLWLIGLKFWVSYLEILSYF